MNVGTYLIVLKLDSDLKIERPREMVLKSSCYIYVGSAMNSLTGRLKRHLSKKKKIHWHIDQLTEVADPVFLIAFVGERMEEELSRFLSKRLRVVKGFGSSDLKVEGNLFYCENSATFISVLKEIVEFLQI